MAEDTRRCVGSARFGIDTHDAPVEEFSAQPSQKDGLSRMCSTHWKAYVAGLAREAKERKAVAVTSDAEPVPSSSETEPVPGSKGRANRVRAKAGGSASLAQESAGD
jgi:hypothetical protein